MFERLGPATRQALNELLVTGRAEDGADAEAADGHRSVLNELKADAGAISLESVLAEIAKLQRLRGWGCRRTCSATSG